MTVTETPTCTELEAPKSEAPARAHRNARILLIDASTSERIGVQLTKSGYEVVGRSTNPWQGLALVGSLRPDAVLIVADLFETRTAVLLARRIREHHSMAVILLSADKHPRTLAQLRSVRAHGIVELPATSREIDATVQAALSKMSSEPRVLRLPRHVKEVKQARGGGGAPELFDRFRIAAARATRTGSPFAVGVVGIRSANRNVDERITNEVRSNGAERLKRLLRGTDAVASQPNGRLAFLIEDVDAATIDAVGERITRALSEPMRVGNGACVPLPIVGIALWQSPNDDASQLLADAESALADKARDGSKGWRLASPSLHDVGARSGPPAQRRSRNVKWSVVVQRTVGWISLITLGWVVANYSEIMRAKSLFLDPQQVVAQLHQLIGQVQQFMTAFASSG